MKFLLKFSRTVSSMKKVTQINECSERKMDKIVQILTEDEEDKISTC